MSIAEVSARIDQIRAQLALLAPQQVGTTGTAFAQALGTATTAAAASAQTRATGGGTTSATGTTPTAATAGTSTGTVPDSTPYASLFRAAGEKHGVAPRLLAAVAKQESSYDPRAVSPAGAKGLMQLMPATAHGLGVDDPFDPAQSVDGAARLLRNLIKEFGRTDLALAAYNAGPGAVHKYDGIPPYPETKDYVRRIMSDLEDA